MVIPLAHGFSEKDLALDFSHFSAKTGFGFPDNENIVFISVFGFCDQETLYLQGFLVFPDKEMLVL